MIGRRAVLGSIIVAHLGRVVDLLARLGAGAQVVQIALLVIVLDQVGRLRSHHFIVGTGIKSLDRRHIRLEVKLTH